MCGIIGIIGKTTVAPSILDGLKRLEYRGYDSAGIATIDNNQLHCVRTEGKLAKLEQALSKNPLPGSIGIGHTRWATHGKPNDINAHPHRTDKLAVVHNGIIENFHELRQELEGKSYNFHSETDTEVIPVLIHAYMDEDCGPEEAVFKALNRLEGAFALGIIFSEYPETLMAARKGSPLAIGYGTDAMYVGSDATALAPFTNQICYLEDGDWAVITPDNITIYDDNHQSVARSVKTSSASDVIAGKGNYRHFMLKEIYEQPSVIGQTLNAYYNPVAGEVTLPNVPFDLSAIEAINIVACGTSFYAASVAKYWLEYIANIPTSIDIASEFRYRNPILKKGQLTICISQSGETADTLAALKFAKEQKQHILSIVNVAESSIAHASDLVLRTFAGPEIGVASTKAFTTQLVVLACVTLAIAQAKKTLSKEEARKLLHMLAEVPARASEILNHDETLHGVSQHLVDANSILYIGRGTSFAIAQEGALKLKELSYIHAEGVAAGELKHGPIALIDEYVPVIVIAPSDRLCEKTTSNVQEVIARGGQVVLLGDKESIAPLQDKVFQSIELPVIDPFVAPILYTIPVQLLAYHTAVLKGTDVDQPRNLAKSVTVE